MSGEDRSTEEILASLEGDAYFRDWTDPHRLLTRGDLEDAIATVLGTYRSAFPLPSDAQERAMAKLALFQVIAPYLDEAAMSWADLLQRLGPEEIAEVEALLSGQSLGEFLE